MTEMKPIESLGMHYDAPAVLDAPVDEVARITAAPHPVEGCPDMWLIQIRDDGGVTDEFWIRPREVPAMRRVLAMITAYVADEEDEKETSK